MDFTATTQGHTLECWLPLLPVGTGRSLARAWSSRVREVLGGGGAEWGRGKIKPQGQTPFLLCPKHCVAWATHFPSLSLSFSILNTCPCLGSSSGRCPISALSQPGTKGKEEPITHWPEPCPLGIHPPSWPIFSPCSWREKALSIPSTMVPWTIVQQ
jgi:hypothetical protein